MVQAAGSSAGLVLTRTIVHDVYGRERSGQVIAYLTVVMIFVPMLSPLAGGILLDHVGWRAIFFLCAAIGLGALATLAICLPETNLTRRADLGLRSTLASFGALARDPHYLGPALFFSLIMATFFATQAALPYLIVEVHGGTATEYGVWFAVACAFYVAGNYASGRWGGRFERGRLILASSIGSSSPPWPAWRPRASSNGAPRWPSFRPSSCASSAHWRSRRCRPKPWPRSWSTRARPRA